MLTSMPDPALVIGSGPNGLAAAITLAEAGRAVTVLEAADRAGGAVATEELTLPGFRHDTFSAVFPARPRRRCSPAGRSRSTGCAGSIRATASPIRCPAGTLWCSPATWTRRRRSLDAVAPGDGAAWTAFARPYLDHFGAWRDTLMGGFPPVAGATRLLAGLGPARAVAWARLLPMPAATLAARLFAGDGSRAWLYGSAMHGDVPLHGAGSAIAAVHLNVMGHAVGWPSPEGGAGRLAAALAGHLEALGGVVRTGAPVTRSASSTAGSPAPSSRDPSSCPPKRSWRTCPAQPAPAGGRRARRLVRARVAGVPLRAVDPQGRLGAGRADPVDGGGGAGRGHGARRRHDGGSARRARPRTAAAPVHAARPAVGRRSHARARRQAHRLGVHARPPRRRLAGRARRARRAAWRHGSRRSRRDSAT